MIDCGVLNMHECIRKQLNKVFRIMGDGDYIAGGPGEHEHGIRGSLNNLEERICQRWSSDRRFIAMIGYLGGSFNICGVKWYGSNSANPQFGLLPRSMHILVINDVITGLPLAIMEGTLLSAMRTGAVPGVAAKYLAKGCKSVGNYR